MIKESKTENDATIEKGLFSSIRTLITYLLTDAQVTQDDYREHMKEIWSSIGKIIANDSALLIFSLTCIGVALAFLFQLFLITIPD